MVVGVLNPHFNPVPPVAERGVDSKQFCEAFYNGTGPADAVGSEG